MNSMPSSPSLPHHKLIAYGVARDLLLAVRAASIRDAKLATRPSGPPRARA